MPGTVASSGSVASMTARRLPKRASRAAARLGPGPLRGRAFEDDHRVEARSHETRGLVEHPAADDRGGEVLEGLAFDQDAVVDEVVAEPQLGELDVDVGRRSEEAVDRRTLLAVIDDDAHDEESSDDRATGCLVRSEDHKFYDAYAPNEGVDYISCEVVSWFEHQLPPSGHVMPS